MHPRRRHPDAAPRRQEHARPPRPTTGRAADRAGRRGVPRRRTTRCWPSSRCATSAASPSCRSAAARASSAASTRAGWDSTRVIALDLAATAALIDLDETSLLATFGAGTTGPQAEELLGARGYTLGHFPQSFRVRLARRIRGDAVERPGLPRLRPVRRPRARPAGRDPGRRPAARARARERRRPRPAGAVPRLGGRLRRAHRGHRADPPGPRRDEVRLVDLPRLRVRRGGPARAHAARHPSHGPAAERQTETRVNAAMGAHFTRMRGCLAVATFEGRQPRSGRRSPSTSPTTRLRRARRESPRRGARALVGARPVRLPCAARHAARHRRARRDARDRDDLGAAGRPSRRRSPTRCARRSRAAGTKPIVLCHISHVYPAGASLYFTVVAALTADPLRSGRERRMPRPARSWRRGGTITHHHAVGRDHLPYLEEEIGPLGMALLRATKAVLDPHGIMNPGVLVSAAEPPQGAPHREHRPARQPDRPLRRAHRRGAPTPPTDCASAGTRARRSSAAEARRSPVSSCAPRSGSASTPSSSPAATARCSLAVQELAGTGIPLGIVPSRHRQRLRRRARPPCAGRRRRGRAHRRGRDTHDRPRPRHQGGRVDAAVRVGARERVRLARQRPRERHDAGRAASPGTRSRSWWSSCGLRGIPFEVDLRLADDSVERVAGDLVMATVGNTTSYGGGIPICPDADPTDGLLDVTLVRPAGRLRLLRLLPRASTAAPTAQSPRSRCVASARCGSRRPASRPTPTATRSRPCRSRSRSCPRR